MIVNRNGQDFLGAFLADNVLIENPFDFGGLGYIRSTRQVLVVVTFLGDDIVTQIDALVSNIDGRTGNQLSDLVLTLAAK